METKIQQDSGGGLVSSFMVMQEIMIASMSILVNILGMVQLPYGGPEGPKSGLLASDVVHLANNHYLWPLCLCCKSGWSKVCKNKYGYFFRQKYSNVV